MSKPQALILILLVTIFLFRFISEPHFDPSLKSENDSPEYFIVLRQFLSRQINPLLPDPQSGLLNGIILGLKADLPLDLQQALKNTSTVHIVVLASGQNLTILSGLS